MICPKPHWKRSFWKEEHAHQKYILFQSFSKLLEGDWKPEAIKKFWVILEGDCTKWRPELLKVVGEMDEGDIPHIEAVYHKVNEDGISF